jgi:phosphoribosylpyrophosphate synthetase
MHCSAGRRHRQTDEKCLRQYSFWPLHWPAATAIMQKSPYSKVFVTNRLYIDEKEQFSKLEIVSLAPMLSEVIKKAHLGESIRYENW